ncbi:MAG: pyruvate formate lyase-activating protein [Deltaproteobacteria bacterium]|nr:pyruvate formate lyase-activating protein [Deltaproteobacteria bacterium]
MRIVEKDPGHITAKTPPVSKVGFIHSVDSCGTVDGPGVRFIVFTSGCPLACQYCHNPDAICKSNGEQRSVNSVLDELGTYAGFIERAGGGLTVSGGEPLMQSAYVTQLFRGAKERFGLHTCLDTSGHGNLTQAEALLEYTDMVLLDIKSWNPQTYRDVTGQPIDACLRFAKLLQKLNKPTWIRYVLVPGLTDAKENLEGLAAFLKGFSCIERIELLGFHKMGEYKWEEMGMPYRLKDTNPPTREQRDIAKAILEQSGHRVVG